jgi:bidirectional [NiFe] hydrogenase diaphorase subunit
MNAPDRKLVSFRLDGRTVHAAAGSYVLAVARDAGIDIPTLCDHPALEPVGACRLCMVEVTHPDWKGWKGLMTSCLYPVSEGIEVQTRSERVLAARRQVLTLLAARCPDVPAIRSLAEQHGCRNEGLKLESSGDKCIVCGLCTRVCEAYATAAITTLSRGATKNVGPFAGEPPAECVGCGACAQVCPTDNIPSVRTAGEFRIWDRSFPTHVAAVLEAKCTGCGSCEEACPFAVARVLVTRDGRGIAAIPVEHCRGCGACVGACPSGAIDQRTYGWQQLLEPLPSFMNGGAP